MNSTFISVYGPVKSWRFGQSLGIDPIGSVSTCSFNCVYCQLGEIRYQSCDRQVFVPTQQIGADLQSFAPWDVDIITLSGSGEPTLARNLEEILVMVKAVTAKPVGVLTNGSLLAEPMVQEELAIADRIAVKIDAISFDQFRRINRPVSGIQLREIWSGLQQFRQAYQGILAIQTMLLSPWSDLEQADYIALMQKIAPDEIQLNTPTRPKPLKHQLDARGNHNSASQAYPARLLKPVSVEYLKNFGDRIQATIGIPVRYPLIANN
jgi:wyosine [tRNA(Phe)-imidazoG37] synthetase (radical SAM superfamily)